MFEWDPVKAARNEAKHGVSFEEAATVFRDPFALDAADIDHSWQELRFRRIGTSVNGRLLMVVYILRGIHAKETRIISARQASRKAERRNVGYQTLVNEVLADYVRKRAS